MLRDRTCNKITNGESGSKPVPKYLATRLVQQPRKLAAGHGLHTLHQAFVAPNGLGPIPTILVQIIGVPQNRSLIAPCESGESLGGLTYLFTHYNQCIMHRSCFREICYLSPPRCFNFSAAGLCILDGRNFGSFLASATQLDRFGLLVCDCSRFLRGRKTLKKGNRIPPRIWSIKTSTQGYAKTSISSCKAPTKLQLFEGHWYPRVVNPQYQFSTSPSESIR